jgi:hypothetical protein
MRPEVRNLLRIGPLPSSTSEIPVIQEWEDALEKITFPLSDEEAGELVALFPACEDECFGLAWTLLHLVESAPNWPIRECLQDTNNPWIVRLRKRSRLD